jgi:hypothetical protein
MAYQISSLSISSIFHEALLKLIDQCSISDFSKLELYGGGCRSNRVPDCDSKLI